MRAPESTGVGCRVSPADACGISQTDAIASGYLDGGRRGVSDRSKRFATGSVKAILDTRPDTEYDDDIVRRYHFPNLYLSEARRSIGDWVVYREPRRGGGRQGYVAVARVTRIAADPSDPGSSYAHVAHYLAFDAAVPLRREGRYYEARLAAVEDPSRIGAALRGRSIRTISDEEFGAITHAGLAVTLDPANAHGLGEVAGSRSDAEIARWIETVPEERERRIEQIPVNRRFRDAAFRTAVVSAYEERCAVTRLRIVNGGGKAEVEVSTYSASNSVHVPVVSLRYSSLGPDS